MPLREPGSSHISHVELQDVPNIVFFRGSMPSHDARYIFGSVFFSLSEFITPTRDDELRSGMIEARPQMDFRAC